MGYVVGKIIVTLIFAFITSIFYSSYMKFKYKDEELEFDPVDRATWFFYGGTVAALFESLF